jgi:hypothetical protein
MRKYIGKIVVVFAICALTGISALADNRSDRITFDESFQLNGTTIKKGTYKVTFDETTGELAIKKDEKVIAKANAHAEKGDGKSDNTKFSMATENGNKVLRSVTYSGDNRVIVVGAASGSTSTGTR